MAMDALQGEIVKLLNGGAFPQVNRGAGGSFDLVV